MKEEREVIQRAHFHFAGAVFAVTVILIPVFIFLHGRQIETLREEIGLLQARNDGLKEELGRKEDQLSGTDYPKKNRAQLKLEALKLFSEIRDFVEDTVQAEETSGLGHQIVTPVTNVILGNPDELPLKQELFYERHFKTRAIVLRDRMVRQLPPSAFKGQAIPQYYKLTIPAIRAVANDLERLAILLDTPSESRPSARPRTGPRTVVE